MDLWLLQHLVPEACLLMAVADLHDVELLNDTAIKREFLLFELFEASTTQVDGEYVEEARIEVDVTFSGSDFVGHGANIALLLEKCSRGFLASIQTLDIFCRVHVFLFELLNFLCNLIANCKSSHESIHIIDFTLHPVVEISEWIP